MHTQLLFVTTVLTVIPQAFAYVYSTEGLCKTTYATKSPVSVKSTSYAITIPLTFTTKYTSTPTVTITPAPVSTAVTTTSTITIIVPTAATSSIYTTTTSTSTVFTTSTQIITTTTTTTGSTSTIPTPAGFTPIISAGYLPRKRSAPKAIGGRLAKRATTSYCQLPYPTSPHSYSPPVYPTAVTCAYLVEAITTTTKTVAATKTATTTLVPSTKTGTSTAFTTVTSFSTLPGLSTTITISALPATTTSTITTSTTATVTVGAPTATFYAACAQNNIVDSANGGNGIPFVYYYDGGLTSTSDTTPYDCCVSCETGVNCNAFAFLGTSSTCYNIAGPSFECDGSVMLFVGFQSEEGYSPSDGYTVGNGPCGQLEDEGTQGAGSSGDPPSPPSDPK